MMKTAPENAPVRFAAARKVMARPALHVVLALMFAASFFWPIFAMEKPASTFNFLYLAWAVCLVVLFAVSRGVEARDDDDEGEADAGGPH
jgi:predicted membrane protein